MLYNCKYNNLSELQFGVTGSPAVFLLLGIVGGTKKVAGCELEKYVTLEFISDALTEFFGTGLPSTNLYMVPFEGKKCYLMEIYLNTKPLMMLKEHHIRFRSDEAYTNTLTAATDEIINYQFKSIFNTFRVVSDV